MEAIDSEELLVECPQKLFVPIAGKKNYSYAVNPTFAYRYHDDFTQSNKTDEWNDVYDKTALQIDRPTLQKLRMGSKEGYMAIIEYLWLFIIQSNPLGHAGHVFAGNIHDLLGYLNFVCNKYVINM